VQNNRTQTLNNITLSFENEEFGYEIIDSISHIVQKSSVTKTLYIHGIKSGKIETVMKAKYYDENGLQTVQQNFSAINISNSTLRGMTLQTHRNSVYSVLQDIYTVTYTLTSKGQQVS